MADSEAVNSPAAATEGASPSADGQSVAESSPTTSTPETTQTDVINPSIEADPWANVGVEPEENTADKTDTDEPAKPVETDEAKPAAEEKPEEKSIEDQLLEEAFGEKPPAEEKEDKPGDPTDEAALDKADPKEMIERQRNAQARAWAERNSKRAEIVKEFAYSDKPITEIATNLRQLNETRYTELAQHAAHELVDANPEQTFQRAFMVSVLRKNPLADPKAIQIPSLESVITGTFAPPTNGNGNGSTAAPDANDPMAAFAAQTKALDEKIGFDWRDPANDDQFYDERELAMAKIIRDAEASMKAMAERAKPAEKAPEPKEEKPAGNQPAYTPEETEQIRVKLDETVNAYRSEIEAKILPHIAKNTGLEISDNDTPEIKDFKENLMLLYRGTDYQRANNLPSEFESFATNESTVAGQLEEVYTRIVDVQLKEVLARRQGKTAEAERHHAEAEAERMNVINLLGQANREFKTKRIDPHLRVIGSLSTSLTQKTKDASRRVEITSNGGEPPASPKPTRRAESAEDVWANAITDAEEEDRLRAAA